MTSYRYRSDSNDCKEKVNDLNQTDVKSAKIIQTVKQHVTEVQICSFTEFFLDWQTVELQFLPYKSLQFTVHKYRFNFGPKYLIFLHI